MWRTTVLSELKKQFKGKTALVTGHTGFKGSWLTIWLQEIGVNVIGYSLDPPTVPNLFELANLEPTVAHFYGDVRDYALLESTIAKFKPDLIFHLAAQPIVLHSYTNPQETFSVNAGGTVNLLEACRGKDFLQGIVIITTDKCYENKEWVWGYRENDPLGGKDPYSASKAMAEIATASYRASFFFEGIPVASARAGNVIGGGDFSDFRLIPDSMQALLNNKKIKVRNPESVRPWMHVLDPIHGYLMLAAKLLTHKQEFADAWNFGPQEHQAITTREIVEKIISLWGEGDWIDARDPKAKPEMNSLKLNWDKAANRLHWRPCYDWHEAIGETVRWFKAYRTYLANRTSVNIRDVCKEQIYTFMQTYNLQTSAKNIGNHEIYTYPAEKRIPH